MLRRTLFFVATAAVFALVGWQAAKLQVTAKKHDLGDQECKGSSCNVSVMVDCPFILKCYVSVDFEMTRVKKDNEITWDIANSSYEFAQKNGIDIGIVFLDLNNGFGCQSHGKRKITCRSKESGVFKYTINVKDLDPLDPWVFNN